MRMDALPYYLATREAMTKERISKKSPLCKRLTQRTNATS